MSFHYAITFLRDLNKNNSKEWMDEHRDEYEQTKDFLFGWIEAINGELARIDDDYSTIAPKKALSRINNNLLYHPNAPTYKDHFGISLVKAKDKGGFYLHLGLNGSFLGGGYHHPSSKTLGKIRDAIDHNGEQLKAIITQASFVDLFGGLDDGDKLKTAPRGFSQDHEHIELLRLKSYTARCEITQKEMMSDGFVETVLTAYKEIKPLLVYLNEAVVA